jgi:hypothetical protein
MWLSSLCMVAVLLFSSIVFAQHHEAASAPSPAPSAAPASSTSAPPAASAAPGVSNSAPSVAVSHTSSPSAPSPAGLPESRVAPSPTSTVSHGSISPPAESRPNSTAMSPTHELRSDPGRLIPDQRITGETKIVSAPSVGQNSTDKEPVMKPGPPQLRHRICDNGPCKENGTEWKADPPRSDLRHRICPTWGCGCPPGHTAGKSRCVANLPIAQPGAQSLEQCQPGEVLDGTVCTPSYNCAPGERWNGGRCVSSADECASLDGRAAILVNELRGLTAQIQGVCGQNPNGQECESLKQRQRDALQRYQMLLAEAGPRCQGTLEPPASLE